MLYNAAQGETDVRYSTENLQEKMSGKTDEELYDILYAHSQDFTQNTIEAAKAEFSHRQLDTTKLSSLSAVAETVREKENAHLSWPLRILAFFVSSAIVFIPAILAHRHYTEKGEKRKAREWVRWAAYGFVFYCLLGVLSRALTSRGY
jgi:hypothetical protein